jgi:hypothetical protein
MAPTTRSSTKKSAQTIERDIAAHTDERDIISWTSHVSGEILYYERLYVLEEEAEVLFEQLRMTEKGELVPYTKDSEDGTTKIHMDNDETVTNEIQKMKAPQ